MIPGTIDTIEFSEWLIKWELGLLGTNKPNLESYTSFSYYLLPLIF